MIRCCMATTDKFLTSMPHVMIDIVFLARERFLTNIAFEWCFTGVPKTRTWREEQYRDKIQFNWVQTHFRT